MHKNLTFPSVSVNVVEMGAVRTPRPSSTYSNSTWRWYGTINIHDSVKTRPNRTNPGIPGEALRIN